MTFPTELKRWFMATFASAFTNEGGPPPDVSVLIIDLMVLVKYRPDYVTTVEELMDYFSREVRQYMSSRVPFIRACHCMLDRAAPAMKRVFAHHKRDTITPHPNANPDQFVIPRDGELPVHIWEEIVANRALTRCEIYPIVHRALWTTVPLVEGQFIMTHGIPRERTHSVGSRGSPPDLTCAYYRECKPAMVDARTQTFVGGAPSVMYEGVDERSSSSIGEADLMAVRCAMMHPNQNILVHVNDGDLLSILLGYVPQTIDRVSGEPRNQITLCLPGSEGRPNTYVNMYALYRGVNAWAPQAQCPWLSLIALVVLAGTDFFGDWQGDTHGLFYGINHIKHVIGTFERHSDRFSHMVQLYDESEGTPNTWRQPYLDMGAFRQFVLQCYKSAAGKHVSERCDEAELRAHFEKPLRPQREAETREQFEARLKRKRRGKSESEQAFAARLERERAKGPIEAESNEDYERYMIRTARRAIPPNEIIERYGRLLLWNLTYWLNEYCDERNPLIEPTHPIYGLKPDGTLCACTSADPLPPYTIDHSTARHYLGKYRWN